MKIPAVKQIFSVYGCNCNGPRRCQTVASSDSGGQPQSATGRKLGDFSRKEQEAATEIRCRILRAEALRSPLKAKCPIVPVALIDSYKPFDKNEPGRITVQVHILTPIVYEEYKDMKTAEIAGDGKRTNREYN